MDPLIISIVAFVGVAALVGGVAMLLRGDSESTPVEDRLQMLTTGTPSAAQQHKEKRTMTSVLQKPLDAMPGILDVLINRIKGIGNLQIIFDQADTTLTMSKFAIISCAAAFSGMLLSAVSGINLLASPFAGLMLGSMPLMWVLWRRKRRLKKFTTQLPDALELISRALRAGHSLAAGFDLVSQEMTAPVGIEFGRVFEEQNLGIPMEEALEGMTERVPSLDLRFFVTAIILQRQTGGDLAEILNKIGNLIRERFRVWGQVQALTGEGRLSGIVLLALPPVLFVVVYRLNPEYIMMLFTDPMGKQMLAGAVILQILGALAIRKIVNIKV